MNFLMLGLSQFNLLRLNLPRFFRDFLHQVERKQKHGSYLGAVIMGIVSSLVASPCVTPALVAALTYISQTKDAVTGGLALFAMGLGMGMPLFFAGTVGAKYLPRSEKIMKGAKLITGTLLLVFSAQLFLSTMAQTQQGPFTPITSLSQLEQQLHSASSAGQPVILDVYASWCVNCATIEAEIFHNPDIIEQLGDIQLLRLDLSDNTPAKDLLRDRYDIIAPPTILFFDKTGKELSTLRAVGSLSPAEFLELVSALRHG